MHNDINAVLFWIHEHNNLNCQVTNIRKNNIIHKCKALSFSFFVPNIDANKYIQKNCNFCRL